ncbi:phospholipid methyltransferase family protein [Heterostelium album PN500]|uniref:Phosphatidylethanolamine N-methyltransferase n=1 Tax=Heterostelium pallidum (strain ATCC 26659 / Pp 5 / PN500) TaxID=670386 RepID=D3AX06_HETP5|nr:phospholipid methyltransferase family protein [Heterostelium album PN500]EFA86829.1 phospholipid methyltransferase family protein [Heterostelium album PN500]|eukprot:XP_020438932.1 phospholipid methyltransferase family protein [Heterostelium album PN500]
MISSELIVALISIVLHVANYNATAQYEYTTRTFTKVAIAEKINFILIGKNTIYYYAVYLIASALVRDHFIDVAIRADRFGVEMFPDEFATLLGNSCFIFGILLNIWTLYCLGIKGMYNGDSFGHIMDAPVTGGVYQYFNDPQYVGTTISCLGYAIRYQSINGFICTAAMGLVFYISVKFVEGPHMNRIYENKNASRINFKNLKSLRNL